MEIVDSSGADLLLWVDKQSRLESNYINSCKHIIRTISINDTPIQTYTKKGKEKASKCQLILQEPEMLCGIQKCCGIQI